MQIVPNNFSFFTASGCPAGALKRPHAQGTKPSPSGKYHVLMCSEWGTTRPAAERMPGRRGPFVTDGFIQGRLVLDTKLPISNIEEEFIGLEILN